MNRQTGLLLTRITRLLTGDLKGSASLLGQEATSYLELRRARGLAPSV